MQWLSRQGVRGVHSKGYPIWRGRELSLAVASSVALMSCHASAAPADDCSKAPAPIQSAVDRLTPLMGKYTWVSHADFEESLPRDPQLSAAMLALTGLLIGPPQNQESLCSFKPVDRLAANGETLLTAAIKTGNPVFIAMAMRVVADAKGNLFAPNDIPGPTSNPLMTPDQVAQAKRLGGPDFDSLLSKLKPKPIEGKQVFANAWDRVQTLGSSGPVVPDVNDAPSRIPDYVTSLVSSQTGVSIGATDQGGQTSPKIQGEIRYTLHFHPDSEKKDADRLFLYVNGNVNSNKDPAKPTNPDWVGAGLGFKYLWSPGFYGRDLRWAEYRVKGGLVENRLPDHHATYAIANAAISVFVPIARDLGQESSAELRKDPSPGTSAYMAFTLGGQLQKRQSGVVDPDQPRSYAFGRADMYLYPLWLMGSLLGEGCPKWIQEMKGKCSTVTFHLDRQVVNRGAGSLDEIAISWEFRPGLAVSIGRSIGVPDPMSAFGLRLPRSAQTQVSLKLQPS